MAAFANVAGTDLFSTWRTRFNQTLKRLNAFAINESSLYANTLTANSSFTSKGLATFQNDIKVGNNPEPASGSYHKLSIGGSGKDGNYFLYGTSNTLIVDAWVDGNQKRHYITANNITLQTGYYTDILTLGSNKTINAIGWFGVAGRATVSTNFRVSGNTVLGAAGKTITSTANWTHTGNFNPSANIQFSGTGNRITGDMSNATVTSRVHFQTNSTNGGSRVGVLPNGTSAISSFDAWNSSSPTNASYLRAGITSTDTRIESAILGSGSYLPMTFYAGGSERMRIHSYGLANVAQSMIVGKNLTVSGNTTVAGLIANNSLGTSNYILKTNGSTVFWGAPPAAGGAKGGGSDQIFWENDGTVTTNYTISSSKNVFTQGPITINNGVTVTVPAGVVWRVEVNDIADATANTYTA